MPRSEKRATALGDSERSRLGAAPPSPARPRRRRLPPHERRQLVLQATKETIAERGLAGTTVRDIAARAGVSIGTISYHFASVDEILAEVLREASDRFTDGFLAEAEAISSARERLYFVIDVNLPDRGAVSELWRLWLDYWARAAHEPELAAIHNERHGFERAALQAIIESGVESGEFRPRIAADVAAQFLGLLDGLGLQATIGDSVVDSARARSLLRSFVDVELLPLV